MDCLRGMVESEKQQSGKEEGEDGGVKSPARTNRCSAPRMRRVRCSSQTFYFQDVAATGLFLLATLSSPSYLHDILYLHVPVFKKNVHCCSPGRRGYD